MSRELFSGHLGENLNSGTRIASLNESVMRALDEITCASFKFIRSERKPEISEIRELL